MSEPRREDFEVDHEEVARRDREANQPVGPKSRIGGPITIVGLIVVVLVVIWVIVGSGLLL